MTTADLIPPFIFDELLLEMPLPVVTGETYPLPSFDDSPTIEPEAE